MESPWKGLSDMDVARATMGQGRPFVACPWSGDGAREPRRSRAGAPSSDGGVPFSLLTLFAQARATKRSAVTAVGWPEG